jgi:hypothetical protein
VLELNIGSHKIYAMAKPLFELTRRFDYVHQAQ